MKMQKKDKTRIRKVDHEQALKQRRESAELINSPINKLIFEKTTDGKQKYPIGVRLEKFLHVNPDAHLNKMRFCNAIVNNIRWRKAEKEKMLSEYKSKSQVTYLDINGNVMGRNDLYLGYSSHQVNIHADLADLRKQILGDLIALVDGKKFTVDHFSTYILAVDEKIKELGFDLFPDYVEVILPA